MSNSVVKSLAPGAQGGQEAMFLGVQAVAGTELLEDARVEDGEQQGAVPNLNLFNVQLARVQAAADKLNEQAMANMKEFRKGKIATSLAPIKTAAGKRTVCFLVFYFFTYSQMCFGR